MRQSRTWPTHSRSPSLSLALRPPARLTRCRCIPRRRLACAPPAPHQINIYLPAAKMLRNVVERMKALSELVVVSANGVGELTLKVETSVVTVKTFFIGIWGVIVDDETVIVAAVFVAAP